MVQSLQVVRVSLLRSDLRLHAPGAPSVATPEGDDMTGYDIRDVVLSIMVGVVFLAIIAGVIVERSMDRAPEPPPWTHTCPCR